MRLSTVTADADDLYVFLFELTVKTGKGARLSCASRSIILGIKIEHYSLPLEIR